MECGADRETLSLAFDEPELFANLARADRAMLDGLSFGVVTMHLDGTVEEYNVTEARAAGIQAATVIGRHFFSQVAPCTDNYLVSHRFATEATLDDTIDYVLTLRMRPTKVRLRLLRRPGQPRMYLAIERR